MQAASYGSEGPCAVVKLGGVKIVVKLYDASGERCTAVFRRFR